MIIGKTFYKRDDFLHARIPGEIKIAFQALAKANGKTASEYLLELVLQELRREQGAIQPFAEKLQNTIDHDE